MALILNPQNYQVPFIDGGTILFDGLTSASVRVIEADLQRDRITFHNPNNQGGLVPPNIFVCQADDINGNNVDAVVNGAGCFTILGGASKSFTGNIAKGAWKACINGSGALSIIIDPPHAVGDTQATPSLDFSNPDNSQYIPSTVGL